MERVDAIPSPVQVIFNGANISTRATLQSLLSPCDPCFSSFGRVPKRRVALTIMLKCDRSGIVVPAHLRAGTRRQTPPSPQPNEGKAGAARRGPGHFSNARYIRVLL